MSTSIFDPTLPLQEIVPSYLYQQYADDDNLQAFVDVQNAIQQGYLDWFNATPLGVYTSPNIYGPLLDWIGNGLYGIARPVFSTVATNIMVNDIAGQPLDTMAINATSHSQSGSTTLANDDYYKRVLTWCTYVGDGRFCNFQVLRKRIARFLFGANGGDITISQAQAVSVAVQGGTAISVAIGIPAGQSSSYFSQAISTGTLPFPFMLTPVVTIA